MPKSHHQNYHNVLNISTALISCIISYRIKYRTEYSS